MSNNGPPIGPREKELLKEIKRFVKEANVVLATGGCTPEDVHASVVDKSRPVLADYDATGQQGGADLLSAIGLHLVHRERAIAEAILEYIVHRGVLSAGSSASRGALMSNEYAFAVAGLQLVVLHSEDRRWDAANRALARAWAAVRSTCTHLDRREEDRIARLYDVYLLLTARASFIANEAPDECLRQLSQMTAHKLVLDEHTYAVVALLKTLTQMRQGNLQDALTTLQRRATQERALHEIGAVSSSLAGTSLSASASPAPAVAGVARTPVMGGGGPGSAHRKTVASMSLSAGGHLAPAPHSPAMAKGSPRVGGLGKIHPTASPAMRKKVDGMGVPTDVFHLCHDLHMYLAVKLDRADEARECFTDNRTDYHRGNKFEAFVKHLTEVADVVKECGDYLSEWTLDSEHLRMFAADVIAG
ncbi:hypothetical protein H9P43_000803 [Blastocladiella emersonii ATCC 22665]|nr:hypothetical protein H9P43_000803 [Blastocladiella emersonii ATCC 22665]